MIPLQFLFASLGMIHLADVLPPGPSEISRGPWTAVAPALMATFAGLAWYLRGLRKQKQAELQPPETAAPRRSRFSSHPQRYAFVHEVLPRLVFSETEDFFALLATPRMQEMIADLWKLSGVSPRDDSPAPQSSVVELGAFGKAALIQMPEPARPSEARFILAARVGQNPRYFVLEQWIVAARVAEWTLSNAYHRLDAEIKISEPMAESFVAGIAKYLQAVS